MMDYIKKYWWVALLLPLLLIFLGIWKPFKRYKAKRRARKANRVNTRYRGRAKSRNAKAKRIMPNPRGSLQERLAWGRKMKRLKNKKR